MPAPADPTRAMAAALLDPGLPGLPDPRFAVHRNNAMAGLIGALQESYPAVARLVGAAFFRAAAAAYARAEPPRSPVLLRWGGGFGPWLDGFGPARSLPYLGDVARLEWARAEAFNAADAAPAPASALAAVAPERLAQARLTLHPAVRLVASRWPVVAIWADVTGPRAGGLDMGRAEVALVRRAGWSVAVSAPPPGAAAFLQALAVGAPLAEAAAAGGADPDFDLAAQLSALFADGLVAAVTA